MNYTHKELTYLLGCYVIIADNEINQKEVDAIDEYMPLATDNHIYKLRQAIFSGSEDCVNEKDLFNQLRLKNIKKDEKQEILQVLAKIAVSDNYVSANEQALLEKVGNLWNLPVDGFVREEFVKVEECFRRHRLSWLERKIGQIENFLYKTFVDRENARIADILLGSLAYSSSLEKIADVAEEDLCRVSRIVENINKHLENACDTIPSVTIKATSTKEVKEISKLVNQTADTLRGIINDSLAENRAVIEKKRRNVHYFTLAFMGRTKAGKSTMHKVITQQENDDIGVGALRTTRYNRSWFWDRLRIVDTPGIGAPGGEVDSQIAKSIIDEADVICYVVTSDSIQETEFDFFETIKERNKPLYIILNVKSNLNQQIRLKRFLSAPHAWRIAEGEQSILGHIERIRDRMEGKYNMDAVEIIPIHLLAAQLGLSHDCDKQTSQVLLEGSNLMSFVRSVKRDVHASGVLKKNLSIIDGTAYQVHSILEVLSSEHQKLSEGLVSLTKKRDLFQKFVSEESKRLQDDLKTIFKDARGRLYNRAGTFAEEHYDNEKAGKAWQSDVCVKKVFSDLNAELNGRLEDFNKKAKDGIEEIASDISYLYTSSTQASMKGEAIMDTRRAMGVIGTVLTAVVPFVITNIWNPAGWVVALASFAIGVVVNFFTSLFTSKSEKIRKATEKLKSQLERSIEQTIEKNKEEALVKANEAVSMMQMSIESILSTYINSVEGFVENLQDVRRICQEEEGAINSLIGLRFLEYAGSKRVTNKQINQMNNREIAEKYPIVRDWTNQNLKFLYNVELSGTKKLQVESAAQMKILMK